VSRPSVNAGAAAKSIFGNRKKFKILTGKKDTTLEAPFAMSGEEREKGWFFLALGGLFEFVGQQADHLVKAVVPLHF
jgi:hypothetical protein